MMDVGLCLIVVAAAFILVTAFKNSTRVENAHLADPRRGYRADMYFAILWSGGLLVQLSSLLRHMPAPGMYNLSWLSLAGFASMVFLCGGYAGRLLLRLEIRRQERSGAMS